MRDAVLTLAHLQSTGLEAMDADLSTSSDPRSDDRTQMRYPTVHDAASPASATRRGHPKQPLPGPVAPGLAF